MITETRPDEVVKLKEAVEGLRVNGTMWCIFEDNAGGIRGQQDTVWEKFLERAKQQSLEKIHTVGVTGTTMKQCST